MPKKNRRITFNGVEVVVFLTGHEISSQGKEEITTHVASLFAQEVFGGVALGLLL